MGERGIGGILFRCVEIPACEGGASDCEHEDGLSSLWPSFHTAAF